MRVLAGAAAGALPALRSGGQEATATGGCDSGELCKGPGQTRKSLESVHPSQDPERWEVAFEDTFEGTDLAADTWQTRFPWGRDRSSVGELQWYVRDDLEQGDFFQVDDDRLRIVADRCAVPSEREHEYCSGLISTHESFAQEFGYFEIRARMPAGQGLWPAFWLLPLDGSTPREIDIFEILGRDPDTVHMNVHYADDDGETLAVPGKFRGPDFSQDFHTFAVDWNAERIVWYVDGAEHHRVADAGAIPDGPFYLIANLAVGGEWPGNPDETTPFPAYLDIDYIRVYRLR